jgi:hypothetical protein
MTLYHFACRTCNRAAGNSNTPDPPDCPICHVPMTFWYVEEDE